MAPGVKLGVCAKFQMVTLAPAPPLPRAPPTAQLLLNRLAQPARGQYAAAAASRSPLPPPISPIGGETFFFALASRLACWRLLWMKAEGRKEGRKRSEASSRGKEERVVRRGPGRGIIGFCKEFNSQVKIDY